ncbi:uncharacterized protein pdzph1 isoform X2 [Austrofundulus limnaeus]|uniref:Uncharacterized protein pdzph1 isoform X2 n=1 Tax=Austrofundulus limnaeus TaxID=52670 RepID=A0A2I4BS31_AUSLI|nr:PREDICTED: uncharacterized protein LOC106522198 isoform X2 [Austrofundulus limnaeus]
MNIHLSYFAESSSPITIPVPNSISYKEDTVEKGETDSLRRETVLSEFKNKEHTYKSASLKENKYKQEYNINSFPGHRSVYSKTAAVEEKAVKIITSVSINDMENSSPKVIFQQSRELSSENLNNSSTPVTSIFNINCNERHMKLEIQETLQVNACGIESTCTFMTEKKDSAEMVVKHECKQTRMPDYQSSEQPTQAENSCNKNQIITPSFTFGSMSKPTENQTDAKPVCSTNIRGKLNYCQCCSNYPQQKAVDLSHPSGPFKNIPQGERKYKEDQLGHLPLPQHLADRKYNTLEDLPRDLASFRIATCTPADKHQRTIQRTSSTQSGSLFSGQAEEREDMTPSDLLSESDNYEPMFMRSSISANRSSFTNDFIYCQRRKSRIGKSSIAMVENRICSMLKKRRQTFPGMSEGPFDQSFSSFLMCSLPFQTDRSVKQKLFDERFAMFERKETCEQVLNIPKVHEDQPFLKSFSFSSTSNKKPDTCPAREQDQSQSGKKHEDTELKQSTEDLHTDCEDEVNQRGSSIQLVPPPCSDSEEQMDIDVNLLKQNEVAEKTEPEAVEKTASGPTVQLLQLKSPETNNMNVAEEEAARENSSKPANISLHHTDKVINSKELLLKTGKAEKHLAYRFSSEAKEHLKPGVHKDRDSSITDHWDKRRRLFKESREWSSAGGNSTTSDVTEDSVSEDTHSMDLAAQDYEDTCFYMETFHSSAWIYRGDDVSSVDIRRSLITRTRPVSIRERTVKINKRMGEYPWGFRIQFSKPIVVTEVDTNGAAEEAGLMVGDYVLAVNGTDVTSIHHSEAAELARKGPDVLILTVGSDIARGPNTPRPPCRGYLHKRTQSGLIKGWRKRWFVLTHDCCLYYYKHKRDEGKRQPLLSVQLEGAEVGPDVSLGKPFVFKCQPQSGNRVYFLCATSNQEMKRWLEAMEKAIHPITQNHVWIDVTRHNSNLPPLAVKNPDCLGLLHKMDKSKDTSVQHYCILKDGCLYLYSGIRATHAHGGVYLQGYMVREQPHGSKRSIIELKPPSDEFKTFYFCAENFAENKRWISAIKASINKWLPLHQVLQEYMTPPPEETRM